MASLPSADFELLRPHLKTIELVHATVLFDAGDAIKRVYFPHTGIISLVVALKDGQTIEVAMIGFDSIVGASVALGRGFALNKGIVQASSIASILDASRLRKATEANVALRETLFRHEQAVLARAQQSAACNATHTVEARLARWLLRSHDLLGGATLPLTQEFLGQMLSVRRTSVSLVAKTLQKAELIKYGRGRIQITDLRGLKNVACECNAAVKAQNRPALLKGS